MDFAAVNVWAVLVSGVAYMALGFVWYSRALFGKSWMALLGMTEQEVEQSRSSPAMYSLTFVGALVGAYVLGILIGNVGLGTAGGGALVGLLAGVGFIVPSFGANYIFERRPLMLFLIDAGYQMTSLIIGGALLGAWR